MDIKEIAKKNLPEMIRNRRSLHRIPEVALTEEKTAAYVTNCLTEMPLDVRTGIAGHGVVGFLDTGRPGANLLIRADMDALPIAEKTDLPFVSTHKGVMHACGHDAHMAMVLGAAKILCDLSAGLSGTIRFIFQPAEEGPGGALPMIEAGVMDDPKVDYSVGCHVWPDIPEGTVGVRDGVLMAAMDQFDLTIIGRGGHGAMPHQCVDALEIGCQVVGALQRIASRQMNPLTPTVVTVGSFHAGTVFNVIPDTARMNGTTRTFDREIWDSWPRRLEKIISGICSAMNARYEFTFEKGFPPVINDAFMSDIVRRCARTTVGEKQVIEPDPSMGGEDMAYYLERSKGCFFCLGTGREDGPSIHNARFDFNEDVLATGVEIYCRIALDLLG
ncbi:MAG: amidohydrolase [Thermodesulfobacteriota bacterium]|nr:amidohydrolase [Thermodesulfobacteriota bacterium]